MAVDVTRGVEEEIARSRSPGALPDPLAVDAPDDDLVVASRRALCRVATVAAEAAARYQREASPVDPMVWMLEPRRLFGGRIALDACLEREHYRRAIVLHALSLGGDADPAEVDVVMGVSHGTSGSSAGSDQGPSSRVCGACRSPRCRAGAQCAAQHASLVIASFAPRRVHSAAVNFVEGGVACVAFHARLTRSTSEIAAEIGGMYDGSAVMFVRPGFDSGHPLLSAAVIRLLAEADAWGEDDQLELDVNLRRERHLNG